MQQPKSATITLLAWILIRAIKGYSHSFRITCDMCAVSLLESREWRYIKAMNNNNVNNMIVIRLVDAWLKTRRWTYLNYSLQRG